MGGGKECKQTRHSPPMRWEALSSRCRAAQGLFARPAPVSACAIQTRRAAGRERVDTGT